MSEITPVGLDLAKNVFQVHGAYGAGRAVPRKKWRCLSSVLITLRASAAKHRFGLFVGLRALR